MLTNKIYGWEPNRKMVTNKLLLKTLTMLFMLLSIPDIFSQSDKTRAIRDNGLDWFLFYDGAVMGSQSVQVVLGSTDPASGKTIKRSKNAFRKIQRWLRVSLPYGFARFNDSPVEPFSADITRGNSLSFYCDDTGRPEALIVKIPLNELTLGVEGEALRKKLDELRELIK